MTKINENNNKKTKRHETNTNEFVSCLWRAVFVQRPGLNGLDEAGGWGVEGALAWTWPLGCWVIWPLN